jgi:DHA2 family multidrug resistance protein
MSGDARDVGWTAARSAAGAHNPWLVTFVLSMATFMQVLDTSIANVALLHIAGSLGASVDESTWIITSYLVANAIILPISAWLSAVIGRKRYYMLSVALFAVSSLLCGLAPSLNLLVIARALQGLGGGGMAPSEQAMLADTFPPSKRAQAFAVYGVAVIVAPALGPTIGGYITDNASWHWIFFINVPVGAISLALVSAFVEEPATLREERSRLLSSGLHVDWLGFLLVAVWLGTLEVVLDRGQQDDWFASRMIVEFSILSAAAFVSFLAWELKQKDPIVEVRLMGYSQFAASWIVMLVVGGILFGTTQLMPQLLQQSYGYTATIAGLSMMPGGLSAIASMALAGRLSNYFQPRTMMAFGLIVIAIATYHFAALTGAADFTWFATARVYQMVALPFLFLTVTSASYVGLPPDKSGQASSLINVARNLGGSIGVAMTQTLFARREQFHQARLSEYASATASAYQQTIHQASAYFLAHGASPALAKARAVAFVGQTIATQSTLLSYIDVFVALALVAALTLPMALLLRKVRLKQSVAAH